MSNRRMLNDKSPITMQNRLGYRQRGPRTRQNEYDRFSLMPSKPSTRTSTDLTPQSTIIQEESHLTTLQPEITAEHEALEKECINNIFKILQRSSNSSSPAKVEQTLRKHNCPENRGSIKRAAAASFEKRILEQIRNNFFEKHPEKRPIENQCPELAF